MLKLSFKEFFLMEDGGVGGNPGSPFTLRPSWLNGKSKLDNSGCGGGPGKCPEIKSKGCSGGPGPCPADASLGGGSAAATPAAK